jgi:trigger factor
MAAAIETISELERRVELSIPTSEVEVAAQSRLKSWARTIKMPGFRPGKVPMRMVAAQYGAQAQTEVIREALDKAFGDAVNGANMRVAGQPRVEAKQGAANDAAYEFTATFEVYPTVTIGDVSALTIEKPSATVAESDVDQTIDTLRKQRVQYAAVDRAANKGDRVMIDFVGTIDGVAFEGGSAKNFALVVGEGRMLPEFEEAMPGLAKGGSKSFDVNFPADYPGAEVAGKTAKFVVVAGEVAEPVLPPVDADFAKAFGVASGDLAQLRTEVRQNLELELKRRTYAVTRDRVLQALREATPIAVPNALAANEALRMAEDATKDMIQRGVPKDKATVSPSTFEPAARERVALGLIVAEVVRTHSLQATPEQVRKYVDEAASSYESPEQVIQWYYADRQRLAEYEALSLESNVVDWVLSKAKVMDKPSSFAEIVGPRVAN